MNGMKMKMHIATAYHIYTYINGLHWSIGYNSVRLYAHDTAIITGNPNLESAQYQAKELFTKSTIGVLQVSCLSTAKNSFVLFHLKNKPIPRNFTCIQREVMQIKRVEFVQYLGILPNENLFYYEPANPICTSFWSILEFVNSLNISFGKG